MVGALSRATRRSMIESDVAGDLAVSAWTLHLRGLVAKLGGSCGGSHGWIPIGACGGVCHAGLGGRPVCSETGLVAVDVGHPVGTGGDERARTQEFEFNRDLAGQLLRARGAGWEARMVNADGRIESLRARPQAAAEPPSCSRCITIR